jgi:hypothetical protein
MRGRALMAALGVLTVAAVARAQSSPPELPHTFAVIKQRAEYYYPAITHAVQLPDGIVIGFIVTHDLKVLGHSVAFNFPEGTTTTDEVRSMFPGKRIAEHTGGGGCFGGRKSKEPRWCVAFAELEK